MNAEKIEVRKEKKKERKEQTNKGQVEEKWQSAI
jgi:hypothetical protein